jgi:hypothetical protein
VANRMGPMGVLVADNDSVARCKVVTYLSAHHVSAVAASGRDDLMSQLIASEQRSWCSTNILVTAADSIFFERFDHARMSPSL